MDHITLRVPLLVSDLDSVRLTNELERVPCMKEPGRKLLINDSIAQDPLNWTQLRKLKRYFLAGARGNMVRHQAGQAGQDTLSALKDAYRACRTERQPDQLCEDVVA